jgi:hypothetical protein
MRGVGFFYTTHDPEMSCDLNILFFHCVTLHGTWIAFMKARSSVMEKVWRLVQLSGVLSEARQTLI